jgi:phosphohistidine phosphatase SixA
MPVAPLFNVAKAMGLRRLVKDGRLTAEEALQWLRKNDYSGSDRIVHWLQRRARRQS